MDSEFNFIADIISLLGRDAGSKLSVEIGDDAAITEVVNSPLVISTDSAIEGIHFSDTLMSAFETGYSTFSAAISDLAAMGANCLFATVNITAKNSTDLSWFRDAYLGIRQCGLDNGIHVVGGNTSRADQRTFHYTVIGSKSKHGSLLRSNAKVGEEIWVSGVIGAAYLGYLLRGGEDVPGSPSQHKAFISRFVQLEPRVRLGQELVANGLSSCAIDTSDGILQDIAHIAKASEVTAQIDYESLPFALPKFREEQQIRFGGDYELAFTSNASNHDLLSKLGCFKIGNVIPRQEAKILLCKRGQVMSDINLSGYDHFLLKSKE